MKTRSTLTLAVMAITIAITASHSEARTSTLTRIDVPHSDLNLAHPDGALVMLQRLKSAAVRVCGGRPDMRDIPANRWFNRCLTSTLQDAVRSLNAPMVTKLFSEQERISLS